MPLPYRRVLLKLSGEMLMGAQPSGIDFQAVHQLAQAIKQIAADGIQIGLVIGGGNLFRGVNFKETTLQRTPADQIGMLATLMNGIALQEALKSAQCPAKLLTALECPKVAETYTWQKALDYLAEGAVVIFVGGTGSPYFTTDTAAALRASEIQADLLCKATKVDGIYSADPLKNPQAVKYDRLSYSEILAQKLAVMDATAIALCRSSRIPIFVFNMQLLKNSHAINPFSQQHLGTVVSGD
jgi:uridylate kinase